MALEYHSQLTGATAIHPIMYIQTSDPGAVGAGKWWLDTTYGAVFKVRDSGNTGWDVRVLGSRRAHGTTGTGEDVDWEQALAHHLTLDDDCTVTFSNPVAGVTYVLEVEQDGTGGHTLVLPSITWPDGAPTYSSGAGERDIFALYYDGSAYIGKVVGQAL
jgi:hypothetical protein